MRLWSLPQAQATDTYRVIVDPAPVPKDDAPVAQVAILLDTSNSMDGLIGQAKAQLWKIVNRVASTTKNGQPVKLEVAIFEYGNNGLPPRQRATSARCRASPATWTAYRRRCSR